MSGPVGASAPSAFSPRLMLGVVLAGFVAFVALAFFSAMAPSSGGNGSRSGGGTHALSDGATGFSGIADLAERTGVPVSRVRDIDAVPANELLVLTPTLGGGADAVADLIASPVRPTLLILPKWLTQADKDRPGWVSQAIPGAPSGFAGVDAELATARQVRRMDATVGGQALTLGLPALSVMARKPTFATIIGHPDGGAILLKSNGSPALYILAEPDLVNNLALNSRTRAAAALALVDAIAADAGADGIAFDLTLHGYGAGRSLLRYAFVPPFVAITICLIAAAMLAGWHAWGRFGPPVRPRRAIALSRAALIASSADLIVQAGREADGAAAYVTQVRETLAITLHAPRGLDAPALDRWLDRFTPPGRAPFSELVALAGAARNRESLLTSARDLALWRKEVLREQPSL